MFDNQLRNVKENIFLWLIHRFQLNQISPISYTVVGLLLGIIGAIFAAQGMYFLGLTFWILNRIFDGFDGTIARDQQTQSDLGGYYDIMADFAVYVIVPIGIVWSNPEMVNIWSLIFLLATFYMNGASWMYLSAILEKRNFIDPEKMTSVEMPTGIIGGAETIVFYSLFLIFPQWMAILFCIMAALVAITIIQRLIWAARNL